MQNPTKSIESLEHEMYLALLVEIPDLQPYVARGLARTAADNLRQLRAVNERPSQNQQNSPGEPAK
jgi:hypothetical protein